MTDIRFREHWYRGPHPEVYNSVDQRDPSTPEEMYLGVPWCRDPMPEYADRLDAYNRLCYQQGRHRSAAPFESCGDALAWLEFKRTWPRYFRHRHDYLMVQCPLCLQVAGQLCRSMSPTHKHTQLIESPHDERELWYIGREKRGLI